MVEGLGPSRRQKSGYWQQFDGLSSAILPKLVVCGLTLAISGQATGADARRIAPVLARDATWSRTTTREGIRSASLSPDSRTARLEIDIARKGGAIDGPARGSAPRVAGSRVGSRGFPQAAGSNQGWPAATGKGVAHATTPSMSFTGIAVGTICVNLRPAAS
jgi:hypothetical protein